MPKIEAAIKEAITRGTGRQVRQVVRPLRRGLLRLRQAVGQLRRDLKTLRQVATQWQRVVERTPLTPQVSEEEAKAARLSPRLIQRLRNRLRLSQTALSQLLGVNRATVARWELGLSAPSSTHRMAVVALRKVGRKEVKDLLARTGKPARAPRRRGRPGRRPQGRRRTKKK